MCICCGLFPESLTHYLTMRYEIDSNLTQKKAIIIYMNVYTDVSGQMSTPTLEDKQGLFFLTSNSTLYVSVVQFMKNIYPRIASKLSVVVVCPPKVHTKKAIIIYI